MHTPPIAALLYLLLLLLLLLLPSIPATAPTSVTNELVTVPLTVIIDKHLLCYFLQAYISLSGVLSLKSLHT